MGARMRNIAKETQASPRLPMCFAGVPGLEPRLNEPESLVLPITPYPKVREPPPVEFTDKSVELPGRSTDEKLYLTGGPVSKLFARGLLHVNDFDP